MNRKYVVEVGDTRSSIAKLAYGDPRLWRWIARTNGIRDRDASKLQPRQVLRVEPLDLMQRLTEPVREGFSAGPWIREPGP